jgi:hypothetical protein
MFDGSGPFSRQTSSMVSFVFSPLLSVVGSARLDSTAPLQMLSIGSDDKRADRCRIDIDLVRSLAAHSPLYDDDGAPFDVSSTCSVARQCRASYVVRATCSQDSCDGHVAVRLILNETIGRVSDARRSTDRRNSPGLQ